MVTDLTGTDLAQLVEQVFGPRESERRLAIICDVPDETVGDTAAWLARRHMAADWAQKLGEVTPARETHLFWYRNTHANNADLPRDAYRAGAGPVPRSPADLDSKDAVRFDVLFGRYPMIVAPTQMSATAPLKVAARRFGFRAATMPGFGAVMIPALRLDFGEIDRRCQMLKRLLDQVEQARFRFRHPGGEARLVLDLRFRQAHASGGRLLEAGVAGNVPSGETYIVPYEGERSGEPSRSAGCLPVQLDGEVVTYRIEQNRAVAVTSGGPVSEREQERLRDEPAYGNMAELGLGVLGDFGIEPVGEILIDEKLGLHLAFGRSEHFGGQVGPGDFSAPEKVVHIDRVYLPSLQPAISVLAVDLVTADGNEQPLIRDDQYVLAF